LNCIPDRDLVLIRISQQQHWGYQIIPTVTLRTPTMVAQSLCVMMSSVDTLTEHQLLCEYYLTAEKCYIT